jgi:hypothetical protein
MKRANILIICLGIFFGVQTVFGQREGTVGVDPRNPVPDWVQKVEIKRERDRPINGIGRNGMMINRDVKARPAPLYKGKESETRELEEAFERTKAMLIVPQNYYEKFKVLLKDEKVNLARLQPEKNCYNSLIVTVQDLEKCSDVVPIPGNGSFYSFRSKFNYPVNKTLAQLTLNHPNPRNITIIPTLGAGAGGNWWNIYFKDSNFNVANDYVQGIIAEIGDVDLKSLNLKSKAVEFLNDFKPSENIGEVKGQNEALKKGVKFNDFTYSNSTSMKLNSTYILRSIDYDSNLTTKLKANKQADMTIALKVVGQESDGSVVIIWKELKAGRLPKKSK